ncbi:MAG TPA: PAS domain S-box protein, partial [Pyrinomonadaceae bacterium]|nr:PAS domain S-box protein [Pyrinomonadaceae bacterium]
MKSSGLTTRAWTLLIAAGLLVAAGTLNFAQRLTHTPPPTDGVYWVQTPRGIIADSIDPDSAAGRKGVFGIMPGDRLIAISLDERTNDEVVSTPDVQVFLDEAGVGGRLRYFIERPSNPEETRYYNIYLEGLSPSQAVTTRDLYVNFVGIIYLLVGLFVLFKQGERVPYVLHFTGLCLAAFVFHFYKSYGELKDLDLAVEFLDNAAMLLFAPLFLHFCAIYPVRYRFSERRRWMVGLLYAPAAALVLLTAFFDFVTYLQNFLPASIYDPLYALYLRLPEDFITRLSITQVALLSVALSLGAFILVRRFVKSDSAIVRQQLKWVVWGSALAITPFTLLYAAGYVFGKGLPDFLFPAATQAWLTDAAILPLVLIPLTFGNSVVRYRLMDVDMVVRRTAVYALTTLTIAVMIGAVVYLTVLSAFGSAVLMPGMGTTAGMIMIAAMAVITMLAAPLKNFLQERTDRFFYGERYDLRNGLLDFGRTLSATTSLEPLLDALVSRLQQVLGVERIAIFIEDGRAAAGYRVARTVGLSSEVLVPPDFREMIRARSADDGIVRADGLDLPHASNGFVRRSLHYYVPCVVRGRMVAVIGLGRSTGGALLSSEDLEILRTVSGYVAVAIENSLLYQEQTERAAELELLKEFNESIVESINVGLLAVDTEGRVTACNTALEEMLGLSRDEATGAHVEDLFAEDFAESLRQALGSAGWALGELRNIYKLHTATRSNRPLILNVALAPLKRADSDVHTGALVVMEDVTSRVRLEEQLQQREKLSSIGLLAAGVAHEINTPLTGVSSYTQMLLGMLADTDPKHAL